MKTSRGAVVVTAFVMMSDVKDEIDVEFIGVDLRTTQLNYFFQGIETGMSKLLIYSMLRFVPITNACNVLRNAGSQRHNLLG
jgi:beta-glucanase (GH16 family)